jgi:hypothetical protein
MLTTLRFRIPKAAGDALQLGAIKRRARQASVTDVRFDVDERRSSSTDVKVTCSVAMAIFLVGELRAVGERAKTKHDTTLVTACSQAVTMAFKAIDDADKAAVKASSHGAASGA